MERLERKRLEPGFWTQGPKYEVTVEDGG